MFRVFLIEKFRMENTEKKKLEIQIIVIIV